MDSKKALMDIINEVKNLNEVLKRSKKLNEKDNGDDLKRYLDNKDNPPMFREVAKFLGTSKGINQYVVNQYKKAKKIGGNVLKKFKKDRLEALKNNNTKSLKRRKDLDTPPQRQKKTVKDIKIPSGYRKDRDYVELPSKDKRYRSIAIFNRALLQDLIKIINKDKMKDISKNNKMNVRIEDREAKRKFGLNEYKDITVSEYDGTYLNGGVIVVTLPYKEDGIYEIRDSFLTEYYPHTNNILRFGSNKGNKIYYKSPASVSRKDLLKKIKKMIPTKLQKYLKSFEWNDKL